MTKQRGFTLIEMLIALMIGTIVAASLTLITRSMAESAANEQMIVEASQGARAGIDMLRFDFMRTGMSYSANPRANVNPNSMVTATGGSGGTHHAYYRNPIVHLNGGNAGPDTVVLVGNFIGDRTYEGEVDVLAGDITIRSSMEPGICEKEFSGDYAFAHLVTATGQTHEVKVSSVSPGSDDDGDGFVTDCVLSIAQGELIDGAFGERVVRVSANQAALYRVETISGHSSGARDVLMRYFIDYDGQNAGAITDSTVDGFITANAAATAVVIAENVVDFQVWFRPIDNPNSNPSPTNVARYDLLNSQPVTTLPPVTNVLAIPTVETGTHLISPTVADIATTGAMVFPEHIRSAVVSLAVRMERTDQSQERGASPGVVVQDELASAPVDGSGVAQDVGNYKVRRYTVEVKLPNIASQMADFQYSGAITY
ncbi:MAG: prepilin-type N-terminal cleavage/methylation domain-containing protein [Deltaproteobacteria bacterium]|nr:prepilin-type N-terminal cleavage/methylation domain-containing protein [Deltaproteobacteria bacterium]MBN2673316.1 prepilin-type N-terminal cleavage/methylation domain-containing protein [Deltaproteobacteria bacterium]